MIIPNTMMKERTVVKKVKWMFVVVLVFLGLPDLGAGQSQMGKSGYGPFFFVDAANVASKDTTKGRVEVFVKIAYSELLFSKFQSTLFRSQYEITYSLNDAGNNLIQREIQDRDIVTDKFSETESDVRFHFSRLTLNVDPGEYVLVVNIKDKETARLGERRLSFPVKTFRDKPIGISDLVFADKIQKDSLLDIVNIVPNVFKSFDNDYKKYSVYFEIYDGRYSFKYTDSLRQAPKDSDIIKIRYRVMDKNQKIVAEDSTQRTVNRFQTFSSIDLDKTNIVFGKYILDVMVMHDGYRASSKTMFDVRLSTFTAPSLSSTNFDLDVAIRQMRHVARGENLNKILKMNQQDKAKWFSDFWKSKDPTPTTERNELMEEYYRRIDYANRYFTSGFRQGWDTDRGMVFVILNAPDNIERHPYEGDSKPYEIWYYYQMNLKLIFVDYGMVGDYELYNRQEFESWLYLHR
jgi:GWxTD domain-containing protein